MERVLLKDEAEDTCEPDWVPVLDDATTDGQMEAVQGREVAGIDAAPPQLEASTDEPKGTLSTYP